MSSGERRYKSDQEIIQALKANEMEAFDQIYKIYRNDFIQSAVYKFKMVPREDITDAWQDTVISFYEQIRSGRLTSLSCSIRSFLFLIGYRYIIKFKRDHIKEISVDGFEDNGVKEISIIELDWDKPMFDEKKIMLEVVQQLPEQSRRILKLRYLEGLSIDEIKEAMGYTSSNAVSVSLSRSLSKLRELIAQINNYL